MAAQPEGRSKVYQSYIDSQNPLKKAVPEPVVVTTPGVPEGRSSRFMDYMKGSVKQYYGGKIAASPLTVGPNAVSSTLASASSPFFLINAQETMKGYGSMGNARKKIKKAFDRRVDDYMSACAKRQYIAAQNPSGVYRPSCTEGTVSGAAEESRRAALSAEFRRTQEGGAASFAKFFETRRLATALAHGCGYEESLIGRFPDSARMTIIGTAEKFNVCSRYQSPASDAESYMADCVARARSAVSTSGGVYQPSCSDGNEKGAAEAARVAGLATKYRVDTMDPRKKIQMKYAQAKFARDFYSNGCDYENELFTKYPATAAGMVNY